MAITQFFLRTLCSFTILLAAADALKFDIEAFGKGDPKAIRCIRNFVAKDTLVVVTATVDGFKGDGMVLDMNVSWLGVCWHWIGADMPYRLRMLWETNMVNQRM